jgi:hypothetical protein
MLIDVGRCGTYRSQNGESLCLVTGYITFQIEETPTVFILKNDNISQVISLLSNIQVQTCTGIEEMFETSR